MNKNPVLAATLSGNKQLIRKKSIEKRNQLSKKTIDKYSKIISDKLLANFNFKDQSTHLFYQIKENKEVNTWFLHNKLMLENNTFYCSIHNSTFNRWDCVQFDPKVNFTKTTFKVPIPSIYKNSTYSEINIIIVPLLAFDSVGNRIGYGKGIYDNILSKLNTNCIKIGVSFFEAEQEIIEATDNDIKLDYCQTTSMLHKFT
ncbi:MAG: 5-formyltetrahydrofolate cyclo-ligase [Crocinitomicaceae bacterium]|nr:5-formyltetrahydrofolate cyclo-ligase [Crocinitomicaceae bacterium]